MSALNWATSTDTKSPFRSRLWQRCIWPGCDFAALSRGGTLSTVKFAAMAVVMAAGAIAALFVIGLAAPGGAFAADGQIDPPILMERITSGALPPYASRVPFEPNVFHADGKTKRIGRHGGTLRMIMGRSKDIRMLIVYGYARLVGYDPSLKIVPDILKGVDVQQGRIFTFTLRKGHRWSDGRPFTTEDFRYYWHDMVLNKKISPSGPSKALLVDGKLPTFEVLNETTIRYSWHAPNPFFLPSLAGASPLWIYRPAHYLKRFHLAYTPMAKLKTKIKKARKRNWVALHYARDRQYRNDNPDLPSLQPWINTTRPPSERFVFVRNPFYHRVDEEGRQLPYIDKVTITIANSKLIPAKVGTGEADLQVRSLKFQNYTFLKRGEKRNGYKVQLWKSGKGSHMALFPNLNAKDKVWRRLLRRSKFRHALSLAINRREINNVVFFGLAKTANNTVLPQSPLYTKSYGQNWTQYDLQKANVLLDELGLTKRNGRGIRLLPDGRPLQIIVETAGEDTDQSDILELIGDSWRQIGVKLFIKATRREVLRRRVMAGSTIMAVWFGLDNGVATADFSPYELAPTRDDQLQWPQWGMHYVTSGKGGTPIDMPIVKRLAALNDAWSKTGEQAARAKIWHQMLAIHAEQTFSIGLIGNVPQPVVINNALQNVPASGVHNWDPGAHFGLYKPDTFWFER